MKETTKTTAIHSLETVRCRIENWRTAKQGRRAMPEELWQAAAELTEHYSINRIAKELRLNYTALRDRISREQGHNLPTTVPSAGFVELRAGVPGIAEACEAELETAAGAKLKIRYTQSMGIDIEQLWQETLRRS